MRDVIISIGLAIVVAIVVCGLLVALQAGYHAAGN